MRHLHRSSNIFTFYVFDPLQNNCFRSPSNGLSLSAIFININVAVEEGQSISSRDMPNVFREMPSSLFIHIYIDSKV